MLPAKAFQSLLAIWLGLLSGFLVNAKYWPKPKHQVGTSFHKQYGHSNYDFGYDIHDSHTGNIQGRKEHGSKHSITGSYWVQDPDGSKRQVDYTADDHNGFKAIVKDKYGVRYYGFQDRGRDDPHGYRGQYSHHGLMGGRKRNGEHDAEEDRKPDEFFESFGPNWNDGVPKKPVDTVPRPWSYKPDDPPHLSPMKQSPAADKDDEKWKDIDAHHPDNFKPPSPGMESSKPMKLPFKPLPGKPRTNIPVPMDYPHAHYTMPPPFPFPPPPPHMMPSSQPPHMMPSSPPPFYGFYPPYHPAPFGPHDGPYPPPPALHPHDHPNMENYSMYQPYFDNEISQDKEGKEGPTKLPGGSIPDMNKKEGPFYPHNTDVFRPVYEMPPPPFPWRMFKGARRRFGRRLFPGPQLAFFQNLNPQYSRFYYNDNYFAYRYGLGRFNPLMQKKYFA